MKRTYFQRFIRFFTITLLLWACNPEQIPEPLNQTEWLERADGFQDKYELEQMVVLSRHSIRTPLVGKGSVLSRLRPAKSAVRAQCLIPSLQSRCACNWKVLWKMLTGFTSCPTSRIDSPKLLMHTM